jgi:hypothetical protein
VGESLFSPSHFAAKRRKKLSNLQNVSTARQELPAGVLAILAHTGKSRSFLCEEPIRNVTRKGLAGFELNVNLTSYRALPLSCIEGLILKIDGKDINVAGAQLVLNGTGHKFADLAGLSEVWWFILEPAILFVPSELPLAKGSHRVEATLITVEPYVTAGRFSFYHPASSTLTVE